MKFVSTREKSPAITVSEAIEAGIAPDGGLYVPEKFPSLKIWDFNSYPELAIETLSPFFSGDALASRLLEICRESFNFPVILRNVGFSTSVLELFHGPTAAFKDIGARFIAECMVKTSGPERTIIVATSGDTGGAVAAAFHKKPGIKVVILFPKDGVSERQKKQLTCWGDNIRAFAVRGDFDDCQRSVKEALSNPELRSSRRLSSANSINIGRLLPQMTYYGMASLLHCRLHGTKPSFVIPSGNVGNGTAALWAKKCGFPIGKIVFATNSNTPVPDYFRTRKWNPLPSVATLANAMDVGNPSNMERVFSLEKSGEEDILSLSVSDDQIRETIQIGEKKYGEVWCPHTAAAVFAREKVLPADEDAVVVATAHPAKFETIVEPLIGHRIAVPASLKALLELPSQFEVIDKKVDPEFWLKV